LHRSQHKKRIGQFHLHRARQGVVAYFSFQRCLSP
jgi:hypothetical protein